MKNPIVHSAAGVTLFAGGQIKPRQIRRALALAPVVVAADKGAFKARKHGLMPEAIFGDFDQKSARLTDHFPPEILHRIDEQDTTDFEKALYSLDAPFVIALGVTGSRLDHSLAAMHVLTQYPGRVAIILSGRDLCFLAPRHLSLDLPVGTRLSLFPMGAVRGQSQGLHWPIDDVPFEPGGAIGTSNRTNAPQVHLTFNQDRMLVILKDRHLKAVLAALVP